MQVRLQGGIGSFEGILEISRNTTWQPVCKENMTMNVARIICQTLGYPIRFVIPYLAACPSFTIYQLRYNEQL